MPRMIKDRPGDDPTQSFRRAWDAALDFGLLRLKDIAFERAIEGELIPVFSAGKLMGYRRKRNDALLMFCLRHYGQDASGKRVTVNYFSSRASAGVGAGEEAPPPSRDEPGTVPLPRKAGGGFSGAEASTMTVRTVITGKAAGGDAVAHDAAAAVLTGFEGVALDAEAQAAIARALEECAARARAAEAAADSGRVAAEAALADDPEEVFFRSDNYHGALVPFCGLEEFVPFVEGEPHWELAGAEKPAMLVAWEEERARRSAGAAGDVGGTASPDQGAADGEGDAGAVDPGASPE